MNNLYKILNLFSKTYPQLKNVKIEIINDDSDPSTYLFPHLKNVIGIVADSKIETSTKQFNKNEIAIIADYILLRT